MPDSPATNVDTTGVVGQTGAIPVGSQATSGANTDTTGTGSGAYGSTTARPEPPKVTGTLDTEGVYGPNQPGSFSPVSTLLSGTLDTRQGFAGDMSSPVYRAPAGTVPASILDTTRAYGFTSAVPTDNYAWITGGTTETASFGAPSGSILNINDSLTIDQTTPAAATKTGVIGAANTLIVVNYGRAIPVTAEAGHVIDHTTPFTATHAGVITALASVVVKKGATTLIKDTDYAITATGSGATANYSILRLVGSVTCADGDAVTLGYTYGNAAYFTPVTLVLTTDYTVTFTASSGQRTFTILRNSASSSVANADTVAVNYNYGNAAYWGSHDPTAVPPVPVIGTAVAGDRRIKVVWTNGTLLATSDIDGYMIQSDTGGTRYVPGGNLNFWFDNVVPGQEYKFRVAAFNEAGLSDFSALSNAVIALNYDEVPTGSLDPKNCVNPIYNADGSIVSGSNLGP